MLAEACHWQFQDNLSHGIPLKVTSAGKHDIDRANIPLAQPEFRTIAMQIKAIFFDIDGTLVDSNDMHVLAWEEAFAGIGEKFDRQVVRDQIGKGTDMLVPTLLPDLDEAAQEKLGDAHGCIFKAKFLGEAKPFQQAHDLLAHAHGLGQLVVLASSASEAELEHYLDLLEARDLVTAVTSS